MHTLFGCTLHSQSTKLKTEYRKPGGSGSFVDINISWFVFWFLKLKSTQMYRPQKGNSGVLLNDILLNIRFKDALKGLQTYFQGTLQFYNIVSFKSLSDQAEWDILVFLTKIDYFQMLLLAHTMKGFVKIQTTTFSSFYKWKSIKITSTVPLSTVYLSPQISRMYLWRSRLEGEIKD